MAANGTAQDHGTNTSGPMIQSGSGGGGGGGGEMMSRIYDALRVVHDPYSTNQSRQEAQSFLEDIKSLDEAPSHGLSLASDKTQSPIIRHYGLSLLEHAVKQKWGEYNQEQAGYLRGWVLQLSEAVSSQDPSYIRAKIAQLWVEVAKRCWVGDWMDMDELLVRLWQVPDSPAHKEFVLQVLEILSDDIFNGDDPVVAMREGALSKACVEIFTPATVLTEAFPSRQAGPNVRCGDDGWLHRVSHFLNECLNGDVQAGGDVRTCAVKALAVLYSLMPWAIPRAMDAASCVPFLCRGLAASSVAVQKGALEALHALYSRTTFTDEEFVALVVPLYNNDLVNLCTRLFAWSTVDAQDIDDDKYQFAKKFSEMVAYLGNYLDRRFAALPSQVDIKPFLELLLAVVQSQSLMVSIPVLVTWTRILHHRALGPAAADTPLVGPLLEVCSSRLIRYENLPDDTEDATYVLLVEDTDTIPERHAFLGNYRRYGSTVIEYIVQLKLSDALSHILAQAENVLLALYEGQPPLDVAEYSKHSMPVLRVDAHFTVVESALKGYAKWRSTLARMQSPHDEQTAAALEADFEAWCMRLLEAKVEDPLIRKRILQLLVAFSTTVLDKNTDFMLKVLEHILVTWPATQPEHKLFNDAIKDLQTESMVELQRLASKMPDHLINVYRELEAKVQDMIASGTLDEKRQIAYQSFLFIIIHRASRVDEATRMERLQSFINPLKSEWQVEGLLRSLGSYEGFAQMMALDKAQQYLARRHVHQISDWGSVELDDEGLALQLELEQRQTSLPLRSTKSFLTYSVEKLEKDSPPYRTSCVLWQDCIPLILPELLKFLSYAHASHNPQNWALLPPEMRSIVGRVLTDRFWQAGISEGSKDDFYARVVDKKSTVEGLASSIRGAIRFVRETCYTTIYCMSRLEKQFYGFFELPGPLANALFADSNCLSAHQLINLLNLVRYLVDNCPVELRAHFLPPLLATCFQQMDAKISSEWASLAQRGGMRAVGDDLTEEMKAESILRHLTYTAVVMVADFLDPARTNVPVSGDTNETGAVEAHPSLRKFCLMQASIVGPLLLFCSHAIGMRDGRSCGVVLRVFRSIVPDFQDTNAAGAGKEGSKGREEFAIPEDTCREIREFISTDVLRAAISSLHDPYFVESQKDLGSLIASILVYYCPLTPTPKSIILSLPGIQQEEVDRAIELVSRQGLHNRQQRAVVLDLLKDLKGVSISEMGKLDRGVGSKADVRRRVARSKMAQEFMTPNAAMTGDAANTAAHGGVAPDGRETPELEGVAGLFNEG